jgi:predicted transcriptional regulator of viral defense system
MGKQKYMKKVIELFEKSPVVDFGSVSRITRSKQYTKQLIRNLISQEKIKRVTKGYYTLHDDPSIAVFCFKPAYLGLQDALSFHNLSEQETIPIIITSSKVRQGIRRIMGANVLLRRISSKYLFGFEYVNQGNLYLPYSDIEKTFIDMVYFGERIETKAKLNKEKLRTYLKKYSKRFRDRFNHLLIKKT